MAEIILGLIVIHCCICLGLTILDLYFGFSAGYKINLKFVTETLLGAFLWPIGLVILWSWNIYNYLRKK